MMTRRFMLGSGSLFAAAIALTLLPDLPARAEESTVSILECGATESQRVVRVKKMSGPQHDLLWSGTVKNDGGYLEVAVPHDYADVVRQLLQAARRAQGFYVQSQAIGPRIAELHQVAAFQESSARSTVFYEADDGRLFMLTRWDLAKSDARLCLYDEFLNARLGSAPATLSLARPEGSPSDRAIWKVTWLDSGDTIQFELYAEEHLINGGSPSTPAQAILDLARALAR